MEDYKDLRKIMKPRRDFRASDELRGRINTLIDGATRRRRLPRWRLLWGVGAVCSGVAALLMMILLPAGLSAKEILAGALEPMRNLRSVEMEVYVRTTPMENFKYISLTSDFVLHRVSIFRSDSIFEWRVDKAGRVAIGGGEMAGGMVAGSVDGQELCRGDIYTWIDEFKVGRRFVNTDPSEVLGYLSILLTPEKILEQELENSTSDASGCRYSVDRRGDDVMLTVNVPPRGDFAVPYMLNASIEESPTIRRYVIDGKTRRLKSAAVSVVSYGGKETEVLRISAIRYDAPVGNLSAPPADVRFRDAEPQGMIGLSAQEAAEAFLYALGPWDMSVLGKAVDPGILDRMYRAEFEGAMVDSIGLPFRSGYEGNTYVPYILRMPGGFVKRHNLVLQQTSGGGWIVVGGL